jgi:hypothetical protein
MSRSEDLLDTLHGIEDEVTGDAMSLNSVRTALEAHLKDLEDELTQAKSELEDLIPKFEEATTMLEKCKVCATCDTWAEGVCRRTGTRREKIYTCPAWELDGDLE